MTNKISITPSTIAGDEFYRIDTIASTHGKAITDGDTIEWRPLNDFDDLAAGQVREIAVDYTLVREIPLHGDRTLTQKDGKIVIVEADGSTTIPGIVGIGQLEVIDQFAALDGTTYRLQTSFANGGLRAENGAPVDMEIAKTEVIEAIGGETLRFVRTGDEFEVPETGEHTATTNTIETTVHFIKDEHNMWGPGDAPKIAYKDYIPIIGGDATEYTISDVSAIPFEDGRNVYNQYRNQIEVRVDGDRIEFNANGAFDHLADGQDMKVQVQYKRTDENGRSTWDFTDIEVVGGATTPVFYLPETGQQFIESFSFAAIDADDRLQAPQVFDTQTLAEFDFDLMRDFGAGVDALRQEMQSQKDTALRQLSIIEQKDALLDDLAALSLQAVQTEVALEAAKIVMGITEIIQGSSLHALYLKYEEGLAERDATNTKLLELREAGVITREEFKAERLATNEAFYADFTLPELELFTLEATKKFQTARIEQTLSDLRSIGEFEGHVPNAFDWFQSKVEVAGLNFVAVATDVVQAAATVAEDTLKVLNSNVDISGKASFDGTAQAGLILDFEISSGEVNADVAYDLDSTATYDTDTDVLTIAATATNGETDETVAFNTESPSVSVYAGLAYDLDGEVSGFLDVDVDALGQEIFDTGRRDFSFEIENSGTIDIVDFDSADVGTDVSLDIPLPGFVGDIIQPKISLPRIAVQGTTSDDVEGVFQEPFFNVDALVEKLMAVVQAKIDFSPELQNILKHNGEEYELGKAPFIAVAEALLEAVTKTEDWDTDGDGEIPFLLLDLEGDSSGEALFHLNTVADIDAATLAGIGKLGFFAGEGTSDKIVSMELDVDQLAAVAANAALGISPNAAINPLDLEMGLEFLFDKAKVPGPIQKAVKKVFKFGISGEVADLKIEAGISARQEFALTIDDISFDLTFEDGSTASFNAEDGAIDIAEASARDKNGDGILSYDMQLTPDARFFNDTEMVLNTTYTLDLFKAAFQMGINVPGVMDLIPGLTDVFGDVDMPGFDLQFGPLIRAQATNETLSFDVFEDLFDFEFSKKGLPVVSGEIQIAPDAAPVVENDAPVIEDEAPVVEDDAPVTPPVVADSDIVEIGGKGADVLSGGLGDDRLKGRGGDDSLSGSSGEDTLTGGRGKDMLNGQGDDDILRGKAGADLLIGHVGDDVLKGHAGKDVLSGGTGDDVLSGGKGADIFQFRDNGGSDVITDFRVGRDVIEITRGVESLEQLEFAQIGDDVDVSFGRTHILVEDLTIAELQSPDNFML